MVKSGLDYQRVQVKTAGGRTHAKYPHFKFSVSHRLPGGTIRALPASEVDGNWHLLFDVLAAVRGESIWVIPAWAIQGRSCVTLNETFSQYRETIYG